MHTALYRPFGFDSTALTAGLLQDVVQFLTRCSRSLAGAFLGLLQNRSFKTRLSFIGQVSTVRALAYGISGLLARSTGRLRDQRLQDASSYHLYRSFTLRTFLGRRGDNYDRFLLRVKETGEGFRLLSQVVQALLAGLRPTLGVASVSSMGGGFATLLGPTKTPLFCSVLTPLRLGHAAAFIHKQSSNLKGLLIPVAREATPGVVDLEQWSQRGKFSTMEAVISHFRLASGG
jgi:hypothetical protein